MNKPLGGTLIDRVANVGRKRSLAKLKLPQIEVSPERAVELWNIATGAYSPLKGFMARKELKSVLTRLRTTEGVFWPIPVVLDIDEQEKKRVAGVTQVFLTYEKKKIAVLSVSEVYPFPKRAFEKHVFGTTSSRHPGVARVERAKLYLLGGDSIWIGGRLKVLPPSMTPKETRVLFSRKKWKNIVAFHTRNVPHVGHEHVQREGLRQVDGLLIQPLVGVKKSGDFRNEVITKAYRYFTRTVMPRGKAVLSFLPYNPYFAGPREALLTAVIRKNFGCTHFIVGRDHTGVGNFYQRAEYARILRKYRTAMGIKVFHFGGAFYCSLCNAVRFDETCPHAERYRIHPSGTAIRALLVSGKVPPKEMMRPEIARLLLKEKRLFVN